MLNMPRVDQVLANDIGTIVDLKRLIRSTLLALARNFEENSPYLEQPKNLKIPSFTRSEELIAWLKNFKEPTPENLAFLIQLVSDNQFFLNISSHRHNTLKINSVNQADFKIYHLKFLVGYLLENLYFNNQEFRNTCDIFGLNLNTMYALTTNLNQPNILEELNETHLTSLEVFLAALSFLESYRNDVDEDLLYTNHYSKLINILQNIIKKIKQSTIKFN